MIKKYKVGNPINTEATVKNIILENKKSPHILDTGEIIIKGVEEDTIIYGLGESLHGLNKKGFRFESFCKDEPNHWEDKKALYGAHNFFIIKNKKNIKGYFIDCPNYILYDMAFTNPYEIRITFRYYDYYFYEISGDNILDIITEFRALIGPSYLPPKWALGFGQSRWSYINEKEVLEVLSNHKDKQIPLDSIYLDIDYMDNYKNFTINKERFPNFKKLVTTLKNDNVHLAPIIDAGVKDDDDYSICQEGKKNGYFCKDKNGSEFVVGVWPGYSLLPDFLNKEANDWFGSKYKLLTDMGIDGFWNDMNEPALFYSKKNIFEINNYIKNLPANKNELDLVLELQEKINMLPNNMSDYESFYHNYNGRLLAHDRVHNMYGYFMIKAASNYFRNNNQDNLLISRASYIGAHRYGGVWQGDNYSCWSHLKLTLIQSISLNMVGFLFTGADIGGFAGDCNEELMTRWLQLSIFQPLFRNHSAIYTKRQEIYSFSNWQTLKDIINIRYSLINYIYDELVFASKNNKMYLKPLSFDYPDDPECLEIEDQVLVGRSIMICPILNPNQTKRQVYLPESMKMLTVKSVNEITETILPKGFHQLTIPKDKLVIFIKQNHSLTFFNEAQNVSEAGKTIVKKYTFKESK